MRKLCAVLFGMLLCFSSSATVAPGGVPPDALGTTADGQVASLASLHGKVVVISFWATWCGYCMKEMPILAGLQVQATERHLPLQVVSVNFKESRSTFVATARLIRRRLPDLMLTWDRDGSVGKPYGVSKFIPVMVMLHKDGTIAHIHTGYDENMLDELLAEISELMNEPLAQTTPVAAAAPRQRIDAAH